MGALLVVLGGVGAASVHRAGRPPNRHRIWPELIGAEGAPPIPETAAREAA